MCSAVLMHVRFQKATVRSSFPEFIVVMTSPTVKSGCSERSDLALQLTWFSYTYCIMYCNNLSALKLQGKPDQLKK